jgi:hypothetical protein
MGLANAFQCLLDHVQLRVLLRCVCDGVVQEVADAAATSRSFAPGFAHALYSALTGPGDKAADIVSAVLLNVIQHFAQLHLTFHFNSGAL